MIIKNAFIPLVIWIGILVSGTITGCAPTIKPSLIHPDSDKTITFTAKKGPLCLACNQLKMEIGGAVVVNSSSDTANFTGGPYVPYSNTRLPFSVTSSSSGGFLSYTDSDWVYVANPKGVFTFPVPNGGFNGYPASTNEQTGANLYRLDKNIVLNHAIDAATEYANATGIPVAQVFSIADNMVAAVAWYVNEHMSWRTDNCQAGDTTCVSNRDVFAANGYGGYSPGWDFPQPADLTLLISGDVTNGVTNDDFQGDCEDHAILRAALLRALGFAPWAIWDVIDNPVTHEYNIVLYEGAYRIMDYGTIDRWLNMHTWSSHTSYYGWNEDHGPRYVATSNHDYLVNNTDNYPGGKDDGHPWSYLIYYKLSSP
jgi:hypothetical protein